MTFCIITHVPHGIQDKTYFAYAPYVREMNIWTKFADKIIVVAPLNIPIQTPIQVEYSHKTIDFRRVISFDFLTLWSAFKTIWMLPKILIKIYNAMKEADHIHLRCPGNMGLLGCIVQIVFPNKPKTAKYAGNWDLNSVQARSYKFQKWILRNTFLTRKCKVLVYGEWKDSSKNIKPFFTASYYEKDKLEVFPRALKDKISFAFIGTLSKGKQPLYAIQLVQELHKNGNSVQLFIYGEGTERKRLENYIAENKLNDFIFIKGNQNQETIKKAYLESHFVVLPSMSEGWPKVIAEGMFWGCLPITTTVSCLRTMLDNGNRGILLNLNIDKDVEQVELLIKNQEIYNNKVMQGMNWSRNYTLDVFENEVKALLDS